jgi:selenocysteine lyase/cysteine desulfurase
MKNVKLTNDEVLEIRKQTKGTAVRIHFNNAGASLPPDVVVETVNNFLLEEATLGGYEAELIYKEQIENAYASIASLINAEKEEIAILENASTGWILAFSGISFKAGDEVITCEMEYVTNVIGFLNAQKTLGIKLIVIPNDDDGNFSIKALKEAISPRTKLIAMTHIGSAAGGMIPITEIGKIASDNNILYLVDACQSAGQVPLDVKQINCDMLSVTGRKYLRAPRGTGFLFVRNRIQDQLKLFLVDGFTVQQVNEHDFKVKNNARRFELYEKNRGLILGLGKAVDYALDIGVDRIWERIQYLASLMRKKLTAIDGVVVHDKGDQLCGIVTFTMKGIESATLKNELAKHQINVFASLAKSTLYYMNKYQLTSVVRASIHYFNNEEEIDKCCKVLIELAKDLKVNNINFL